MMHKKNLLLLTDFSYQAKGRLYFREDVELALFLREFFHVWVSHIDDSEQIQNFAGAILIRNTGPQSSHKKSLMALKKQKKLLLCNDLCGKGDIKGKDYLLDLFSLGFPVIPTFTSKEKLQEHGFYEQYVLKPFDGADSCGMQILTHKELLLSPCKNQLIQPLENIQYEVSFYFIGDQLQYALYAPDFKKRWRLKPYQVSQEDLDFALQFIRWNTCKIGIQRVDACRTQNGKLLLMELEDYNPFLSLNLLSKKTKKNFLTSLAHLLEEIMN